MSIDKLLAKLAIGEVLIGTCSILLAFVSVNWLGAPLIEAIRGDRRKGKLIHVKDFDLRSSRR